MKKYIALATMIALSFSIACSVLKKSDPEKEVRDFLTAFQQNLSQPDDVILKQFDVSQSRQSILTAISLLQNKANPYITCDIDFSNVAIILENDAYKVDVLVTFRSKGLGDGEQYEKLGLLTLWIKASGNSLVITKFDGDRFYEIFATLKSDMQWSVQRKNELLERDTIYAMAAAIQQKYDSVIWYTKYEGHYFFYVIEGTWENYFRKRGSRPSETNHKIGVVDAQGNIVVPIEYDMVGTIGFDFPMTVEVTKGGKVGYYDVRKKIEVLPATHDLLIPFKQEGVYCIAKTDTTYGWYSTEFDFHEGLPSQDAKTWIQEFRFIPEHLVLNASTHSMCEIPRRDDAGYGIVMPPSYLVKTGIFNPIIGGISTSEVPLNGWTEYVETQGTTFKGLSSSLSALITRIRKRYIDGREEFYTEDKLVFLNQSMDTISTAELISEEDVAIRWATESLIEVVHQPNPDYYYMDEEELEVRPEYSYFRVNGDFTIGNLKSQRRFTQTEFAMLDSTYITGPFRYYNHEKDAMDEREYMSLKTLKLMRNEILAVYHYNFPDDEDARAYFKYQDWYKQEYSSRDEFIGDMTEIDRHNLDFLDRVIAAMEIPQAI